MNVKKMREVKAAFDKIKDDASLNDHEKYFRFFVLYMKYEKEKNDMKR